MPNAHARIRPSQSRAVQQHDETERLLIPATKTKQALGTSDDTLSRLEREGTLTVIRLRRGGRKFHSWAQVKALAENGVG